MTVAQILNYANTLADDNIDANTLLKYMNEGINKINIECGLKLPEVLANQVEQPYVVCSAEYDIVDRHIAMILSNYCAYMIKKVEGYETTQNPFYVEYQSLLMQFNNKFKYKVLTQYRLGQDDAGNPVYSETKGKIFDLRISRK